jgi:hypothetical protein
MKGGVRMSMKVVGKRFGTFKDKTTGNEVKFGKLYVEYQDSTVTGVQGFIAEAISVKPELLEEIPVGSEVTLNYNKYGKVEDFQIKNPAKTA